MGAANAHESAQNQNPPLDACSDRRSGSRHDFCRAHGIEYLLPVCLCPLRVVVAAASAPRSNGRYLVSKRVRYLLNVSGFLLMKLLFASHIAFYRFGSLADPYIYSVRKAMQFYLEHGQPESS
jgi:hypothetical protein